MLTLLPQTFALKLVLELHIIRANLIPTLSFQQVSVPNVQLGKKYKQINRGSERSNDFGQTEQKLIKMFTSFKLSVHSQVKGRHNTNV